MWKRVEKDRENLKESLSCNDARSIAFYFHTLIYFRRFFIIEIKRFLHLSKRNLYGINIVRLEATKNRLAPLSRWTIYIYTTHVVVPFAYSVCLEPIRFDDLRPSYSGRVCRPQWPPSLIPQSGAHYESRSKGAVFLSRTISWSIVPGERNSRESGQSWRGQMRLRWRTPLRLIYRRPTFSALLYYRS